MKNLFKKATSILMGAIMIMSISAPAFATNEGKTIEASDKVVTLNRFYIAGESPLIKSYDDSTLEIMTYPEGAKPNGEPTITIPGVDTLEPKNYDEAGNYGLTASVEDGQEFYVQPINIDFSNVEFAKPGEYVYSFEAASVMGSNVNEPTQDVDLELHAYVLWNDNHDDFDISCNFEDINNSNGKIAYVANTLPNVHDVTFTNRFKGNMANYDDEMEFTIIIPDTASWTAWGGLSNIKLNGEEIWNRSNFMDKNGKIKVGLSQGGTSNFNYQLAYFNITLGHEDTLTICDLPEGVNIYITDTNPNKPNTLGDMNYFDEVWGNIYTRTWESNDENAIINEKDDPNDYKVNATNYHYHMGNEDGAIVVIHEANMVIPTGVNTSSIAPIVALATISMAAALGVVVLKVKKE